MKRMGIASLLLGLIVVWGCDSTLNESAKENSANNDSVTTAAQSSDKSSTDEVPIEVEIKSWDDVQAWVASQKGKVVVVDIWSTMCLPCMKEFPHFVAMHNEYQDQIACASVSVDYIGGKDGVSDEIVERVTKFLTDQKSTMKNFVSADADESVLAEIGAVSVPVSLVYDAEGNLHQMFTEGLGGETGGGFTYEKNVIPVVEQLLKSE